ncbi:hypothetical protein BpHYR1_031465 [Brachionus plicatilis]|uniref:Uncharacterized protein n=1 Tax=Brachionus plicatilis TaxID=10195 RepID=A0A3M7RLI2_BRAPC|nr:hypothetical protein BpHYR1_031465 [Brachionus plicatilis]
MYWKLITNSWYIHDSFLINMIIQNNSHVSPLTDTKNKYWNHIFHYIDRLVFTINQLFRLISATVWYKRIINTSFAIFILKFLELMFFVK